jgi:hypothetical protein
MNGSSTKTQLSQAVSRVMGSETVALITTRLSNPLPAHRIQQPANLVTAGPSD